MSQRAAEDESLRREARRLARRLLGRDLPPEVVERYLAWHRRREPRPTAVDRWLLAWTWCAPGFALVDAHCARFQREGLLRRKLVLLLALVEASPLGAAFDTPTVRGRTGFWGRMILRGVGEALCLVGALLLVTPAAVLLRALEGGRS